MQPCAEPHHSTEGLAPSNTLLGQAPCSAICGLKGNSILASFYPRTGCWQLATRQPKIGKLRNEILLSLDRPTFILNFSQADFGNCYRTMCGRSHASESIPATSLTFPLASLGTTVWMCPLLEDECLERTCHPQSWDKDVGSGGEAVSRRWTLAPTYAIPH